MQLGTNLIIRKEIVVQEIESLTKSESGFWRDIENSLKFEKF